MCVRVQVPSAKRRVIQNDVVPLFLFGCESSTIIATCDRQIDVLTRLWSACLENSFAGSTLLVISWFDFVGDQLAGK